MGPKHFPVAFALALVFIYCFEASLLKDTLAKEFKTEDIEEIKVEVVKDEKNREADTKADQDTDTEESKDKGTSEDEKDGKIESSINLETIYRPLKCDNVTKTGKVAVIHYTGWVGEKKFDSTIDPLKRYLPFEFIIGTGSVIKGFEEGIKDMCKGEQRKIVIPPELGYGEKGAGLIPGNATITYEVQLLDIRSPPPQADVFGAMDEDGDKKLSRDEVAEYMKKQAQMHYGAPMDDYYWSRYHSQMVDNIFAQDDEDEDGAISHEEFSGPKIHHEEL